MDRPRIALFAALVLVAPVLRAQEEEERFQGLLRKGSPLVAYVKALIRFETRIDGEKEEEEARVELVGTVADPDGLVICPAQPFVEAHADESRIPLDIKITIEGDAQDHSAFLAAKDTKLGLAFLRIDDLGERKLPALDWTPGPEPRVGQEVACVNRGGEEFDFVPYFELARVCGKLKRPQRGWLLTGEMEGYALPVWSLEGQAVGILSWIAAIQTDGGEAEEDDYFRVLLPLATVKGVADAAKRVAADLAVERATGKKPAEAK